MNYKLYRASNGHYYISCTVGLPCFDTAQAAVDHFAAHYPGETLAVEIDYRKPRGYFETE